MNISLIQVPYDSGQRNMRMGRGPFYFVENGAVARLRKMGADVREIIIEPTTEFHREIGTTFELLNSIAQQVQVAIAEDAFPLILAGNCSSTAGAISGLGPRPVGLIWFDAHGDFNTPETSTTGFLDGMGLAMIAGRCWTPLTARIPGFRKLADDHIVLIGARDLGETESERLEKSGIALIQWEDVREKGSAAALEEALAALQALVDCVYVHIDLDVHDATLAPANHFRPPGGLYPDEVRDLVRLIAGRFTIGGASITAFDPDCDVENRTLQTALELIELFSKIAKNQRYGNKNPNQP
jgi:arginase